MQQIIRISEGFAPLHEEILASLGITAAKRLGLEYWLSLGSVLARQHFYFLLA